MGHPLVRREEKSQRRLLKDATRNSQQLSLMQVTMAVKKRIRPEISAQPADVLGLFHPVTAAWFRAVFEQPTAPQRLGWPAIAGGESTLILAPTGTGKTLTAFLWCLDRLMLGRLMLHRAENETEGCRVIYISPLKALAMDVERNLRSPLAGIANMARQAGVP